MRLALILLPILLISSPRMAADPVDEMTAKYEKMKRDGLVALHKRHCEELLKIRDRAMGNRNLALANKADAMIKSLKKEVLKLDPDVTWAGKGASKLAVGKWLFSSNKWSGVRDLRSDGSIDAGVDGVGKWKIIGNDLKIEYANGASAVFHLPIRGGKVTGKTGDGKVITATRVEEKP